MSTCLPPAEADAGKMGSRLWRSRKDLRDLSGCIGVAMELAREMNLASENKDGPGWCTSRTVDALLVCAQGTAELLYERLIEIIGESDDSLPDQFRQNPRGT
jgi:hypothetical protein